MRKTTRKGSRNILKYKKNTKKKRKYNKIQHRYESVKRGGLRPGKGKGKTKKVNGGGKFTPGRRAKKFGKTLGKIVVYPSAAAVGVAAGVAASPFAGSYYLKSRYKSMKEGKKRGFIGNIRSAYEKVKSVYRGDEKAFLKQFTLKKQILKTPYGQNMFRKFVQSRKNKTNFKMTNINTKKNLEAAYLLSQKKKKINKSKYSVRVGTLIKKFGKRLPKPYQTFYEKIPNPPKRHGFDDIIKEGPIKKAFDKIILEDDKFKEYRGITLNKYGKKKFMQNIPFLQKMLEKLPDNDKTLKDDIGKIKNLIGFYDNNAVLFAKKELTKRSDKIASDIKNFIKGNWFERTTGIRLGSQKNSAAFKVKLEMKINDIFSKYGINTTKDKDGNENPNLEMYNKMVNNIKNNLNIDETFYKTLGDYVGNLTNVNNKNSEYLDKINELHGYDIAKGEGYKLDPKKLHSSQLNISNTVSGVKKNIDEDLKLFSSSDIYNADYVFDRMSENFQELYDIENKDKPDNKKASQSKFLEEIEKEFGLNNKVEGNIENTIKNIENNINTQKKQLEDRKKQNEENKKKLIELQKQLKEKEELISKIESGKSRLVEQRIDGILRLSEESSTDATTDKAATAAPTTTDKAAAATTDKAAATDAAAAANKATAAAAPKQKEQKQSSINNRQKELDIVEKQTKNEMDTLKNEISELKTKISTNNIQIETSEKSLSELERKKHAIVVVDRYQEGKKNKLENIIKEANSEANSAEQTRKDVVANPTYNTVQQRVNGFSNPMYGTLTEEPLPPTPTPSQSTRRQQRGELSSPPTPTP